MSNFFYSPTISIKDLRPSYRISPKTSTSMSVEVFSKPTRRSSPSLSLPASTERMALYPKANGMYSCVAHHKAL